MAQKICVLLPALPNLLRDFGSSLHDDLVPEDSSVSQHSPVSTASENELQSG